MVRYSRFCPRIGAHLLGDHRPRPVMGINDFVANSEQANTPLSSFLSVKRPASFPPAKYDLNGSKKRWKTRLFKCCLEKSLLRAVTLQRRPRFGAGKSALLGSFQLTTGR